MNILLINHYAGSPKHGMEYRPFYLAREWVKLGHNVRIVAASESHLHRTKPALKSTSTIEDIDGIEYLWLKTPSYKSNGLARVFNMLGFLRRLYTEKKQILQNHKPDIIIASSPHPFIFRGAKYIANEIGAKLIYEVRDLWPLSLVEILRMPTYHPLIALMQHEEDYAYKHSDKVASLLPHALDHMLKHGLTPQKFIYSPNGIVADEWNDSISLPTDHLNKIKQFKTRFRFLIGYAGAHGTPNALSHLINAMALFKDEKIGIVLIGDGPEKEGLISQAKELELNNLLFLKSVNKTMIPSFLKQMDALYIGWENKPLYRFGISANKLFEYMISERPIIHSVKAGNDPVTESGCGVSCPPENSKEIYKAILHIRNTPKNTRLEMGALGRNYVLKNHNYSILAKNYIIDTLL